MMQETKGEVGSDGMARDFKCFSRKANVSASKCARKSPVQTELVDKRPISRPLMLEKPEGNQAWNVKIILIHAKVVADDKSQGRIIRACAWIYGQSEE